MKLNKIKELIDKGEITTPFAMSQALREPEPACRAKIKDWHKVYIERQFVYVKDADAAKELQDMVMSGEITNATKLRYDMSSYRQAVLRELENNYDKFTVGKRAFYLRKEEGRCD